MQRRSFLAAATGATTSAVAGCLSGSSTDEAPTGTPTDSPGPTPTEGPTAHGPELVDTTFEVTDVECGSQTADHEVTIGDGQVTVEGTLDGSDGCYSAELVRSEYDDLAGTLYVEVEAIKDDEADVCKQCIVEIDYVVTVEFEHGEPGTVDLEQRGAVSASSSRSGSGSATPSDGTEAPTPAPASNRTVVSRTADAYGRNLPVTESY